MIGSVVAWGLILSPFLFTLAWITGIPELNLAGVLAITPLCIASVGGIVFQLIGLPKDFRKR